jgi:predicted O-methyltransferase YrrM
MEQEALHQILEQEELAQLFHVEDFDSDFAATPMTLLLLWHWLDHHRPRRVLELGGGLSSLIFGEHARRCQRQGLQLPVIVSIDHDAEWQDRTRRRLDRAGLAGFVKQRLGALGFCDVDGWHGAAYRVGDIGQGDFDLCFIDGPPGEVGRTGSLPVVRRLLSERAFVFLDDIVRADEQTAVETWRRLYPSAIRHLRAIISSRGLAFFEWAGDHITSKGSFTGSA